MSGSQATHRKEPRCIYGVVIDSKPTPEQIRDAMLECFREAHREAMERDFKMGKLSSRKDFKKYEQSYTEFILRQMFEQAGGSFDHPTKKTLKKVVSLLSDFSVHFRSREIVEKHKKEFEKLLNNV